jgi:hypothetical protein
MNAIECTHEDDVVALVLSRRWPDAADAELRAHAESCAVCRDVIAIAPALRQDVQQLTDVQVPAAGQIWWRSAIRARADAARAAARPMVWLQAVTGAGAVGAALAGVSLVWPRIEGTVRLVMPSNGAWLQEALPLLLAVGIGVIAAPIAFYLAVPRD